MSVESHALSTKVEEMKKIVQTTREQFEVVKKKVDGKSSQPQTQTQPQTQAQPHSSRQLQQVGSQSRMRSSSVGRNVDQYNKSNSSNYNYRRGSSSKMPLSLEGGGVDRSERDSERRGGKQTAEAK